MQITALSSCPNYEHRQPSSSHHLHIYLNLNWHVSIFIRHDTYKRTPPSRTKAVDPPLSSSLVPSGILFLPDALSLQERRLIVDITLYPDDPDAWDWFLDDASLSNRDAT